MSAVFKGVASGEKSGRKKVGRLRYEGAAFSLNSFADILENKCTLANPRGSYHENIPCNSTIYVSDLAILCTT